jgi:hypothetical protein
MLYDIIHSYCIKKRTLKTKRNFKIDFDLKSYLENPSIFNTSLFLRPVSKLWVSTLIRKLTKLPTTLLIRVSSDLASIKPKSWSQEVISFDPIRIFSSHRQISETITPESLVRLWHMSKHRKVEKVSYDVSIRSFLRLHSIWSEKSRFCGYLSHPVLRSNWMLIVYTHTIQKMDTE